MDKLESKTIKIEDIPKEAAPRPRKQGRLGDLWAKLLELPEGQAEEVKNRDWAHGTMTLKHVMDKAKNAKRILNHKRNGNLLFFWLDPINHAGEEQKQ